MKKKKLFLPTEEFSEEDLSKEETIITMSKSLYQRVNPSSFHSQKRGGKA